MPTVKEFIRTTMVSKNWIMKLIKQIEKSILNRIKPLHHDPRLSECFIPVHSRKSLGQVVLNKVLKQLGLLGE